MFLLAWQLVYHPNPLLLVLHPYSLLLAGNRMEGQAVGPKISYRHNGC